ncbi:Phosphorylase b kinase gamma catalytic chain, liver/testis isoform [Cichlidogyrus casuarinus]|uniref:phosphorylase kinase n=1 Tax=Cichlidogyrus casuarinus TaxID=1844966 RepID=A0ABD2PXP6_9PLAT
MTVGDPISSHTESFLQDTKLADSFYATYDVGHVLGTGASSTVRICTKKSTDENFALKIIDLNSGVESADLIRTECIREVEILRKVTNHPNIIQLHDVFEGDAYIFLVFELCPGGELFDYLTKMVALSEKKTRSIMRQILNAVYFIHERDIVHRDLKPENILLDSELNIKITDFGLAVMNNDRKELMETRGTPGYLAPEVLKVGYYENEPPYGQPVDIWACGVIMYTLLVGCPPFWNRKEHLMLRHIMQGQYSFPSPEWDDISETAKDIIRKTLVVDPSKRITAKEALNHEFFGQISIPSSVGTCKRLLARRRFRKYCISILFIRFLYKLREQAMSFSLQQLTNDPYSHKKLRKIIDSLSFDVYSQWVKKAEDQNRAALFENSLRFDLINNVDKQTPCRSPLFDDDESKLEFTDAEEFSD